MAWCASLLIMCHAFSGPLLADDHEEKSEHGSSERAGEKYHGNGGLGPVNSTTYASACGECHFAYQPGLLPSRSWRKIIETLPDHFGEAVEIDPDATTEIGKYLDSNAAETSSGELSEKILKNLGKRAPTRVTEISYIRKKHRKIAAEVLKRPSVGSLSNCIACHRSADKGVYDDDRVSIPK